MIFECFPPFSTMQTHACVRWSKYTTIPSVRLVLNLKVGKKLVDVVKVGTVVYFHGALIDDSASIQVNAPQAFFTKNVPINKC